MSPAVSPLSRSMASLLHTLLHFRAASSASQPTGARSQHYLRRALDTGSRRTRRNSTGQGDSPMRLSLLPNRYLRSV